VFGDLACFPLGRAEGFFTGLKLGEQGRHSSLVRWNSLFGALENISGEIQAARDADPIRAPRNTLREPVGWCERDRIELQRRIYNAVDLRRELLESAEVCSRDGQRPPRG